MPDSNLHETQKRFREVHHMHRRLVEKRVEQTGVFRSQHMVLMYISEHEGCSQKEIAEAYRISSAAVAVNLKKLEKMGLVKRITDETDNRCNRITTTPKGDELVIRSRCIFEEIDNRMFSQLTEAELTVFRSCLDKLRTQLIKLNEEADRTESTASKDPD